MSLRPRRRRKWILGVLGLVAALYVAAWLWSLGPTTHERRARFEYAGPPVEIRSGELSLGWTPLVLEEAELEPFWRAAEEAPRPEEGVVHSGTVLWDEERLVHVLVAADPGAGRAEHLLWVREELLGAQRVLALPFRAVGAEGEERAPLVARAGMSFRARRVEIELRIDLE